MYRYDLIDKTGRSVLRKAEGGCSAAEAIGGCGNVGRSGLAGQPVCRSVAGHAAGRWVRFAKTNYRSMSF